MQPTAVSEKWKAVPGYYGKYAVSSHGRFRCRTGFMRPSKRPDGYFEIKLFEKGSTKNHRVARLVARAFIGEPPDARSQINHKDGNKANNRVDNLEWVTPSENIRHRYAVIGPAPVGEARSSRWRYVGTSLETGEKKIYKVAKSAAADGFSPGCIYACVRGRTKTHLGHSWERVPA